MDRIFKRKIWLQASLWGLLTLGSQCSSESKYKQAVAVCFPDGIPKKIPMSDACKKQLESFVSFGSGFEQNAEQQKQQVLDVLYFMIRYPMDFPMEKSIYGVAPANQIISQDLRIEHAAHPEQPVNQIFFDYLLDQVRVFKLNPESYTYSGFYIPLDQSVTLARPSIITFQDQLFLAATLNHESRHSRFWDHPIYCPQIETDFNACDQGTNQPYGWEFSFYWAILQGHQKSPLSPAEIQAIGCNLYPRSKHIYGFPSEWNPIQGPIYNKRTYRNYPTLQQIAQAEKLTLPKERDFYQEIAPYCPTNELTMSDLCREKLSTLLPISISIENPFATEQKEVLLQALHAFFIYPVNFSKNTPLFQTIQVSDIRPKAIQELLDKHPSQSANQVFFNYALSAIEKVVLGNYPIPDYRTHYDFCNRTFFYNGKSDDCPHCAFDLLAKLIESARHAEIWPEPKSYCREKRGMDFSYCEKGTDGAYSFSLHYLWALLQGTPPSGIQSDLANYIYQQICYKTHALVDVPEALASLQSLDCGSINYFIDTWDFPVNQLTKKTVVKSTP